MAKQLTTEKGFVFNANLEYTERINALRIELMYAIIAELEKYRVTS